MSYMKRLYEQKCTAKLIDGTWVTICNCQFGVHSHSEIEKRVKEKVNNEITSSTNPTG
jgi:hypothetical protein